MGYLNFEKSQLINLGYSLSKELIRSNRAGSYSCSTIIGCNTRKYHGLLVCPMPHLDDDNHVLLSTLHESIVYEQSEFNLGINKYAGDNYNPKGHKYIRDFDTDLSPKITYRVGNLVLTKEKILIEKKEQVLIKYSLTEGNAEIIFRLKPFLAFRNIHQLSKANMHANTKYVEVPNGIKMRLYAGYPYLNMQVSKENEFIAFPDWYYNIEYPREQERGYDYKEDLFVPGYFEFKMKPGESIIFSASTDEATPSGLKKRFSDELKKRIVRDSFYNCLRNSAEQFFVQKKSETELIAGFPWYGSLRRDTFIALPGLTLALNNEKLFESTLQTKIKILQNCCFGEGNKGKNLQTVDALLWMLWSIQKYFEHTKDATGVWKKYSKTIKEALHCYEQGFNGVYIHENKLIYNNSKGLLLTWMDVHIDGKAVTPRQGFAVEVNALWYNALSFAVVLAQKNKDKAFEQKWLPVLEVVGKSFLEVFWLDKKNYLADYVNEDENDNSVRPNMLIAAALTYTPLSLEQIKQVVDVATKELLTNKGIRSLSPKNPMYRGRYTGNWRDRDFAFHNGSVWPWLFQFYTDAYLRLYKQSGVSFIRKYISAFEEDMVKNGIGSLSEVYDGDPPHEGNGAISYAPSVASILYSIKSMEKIS